MRPGKAYTYSRSGSSWSYVTSFGASSNTDADQFGYSVSIDGYTAAVGSRLEDSAAQNAGMVAVHTRGTGGSNNWGLDYELFQDDAAQGDYFGEAVVIQSDWILGGSPFDDDEGSKSGSVSFQEIATTDSGTVEITVASSGSGAGGGNGSDGTGSGSGSGSGGNGSLQGDDGNEQPLVIMPAQSDQIGVLSSLGDRCCCDQCLAVAGPVDQDALTEETRLSQHPMRLPEAFGSVDSLFEGLQTGLFG